MTIDEAIESMRLAVNEPAAVQCQQMRVLADVWRENGKELHGEALELLGECGKAGDCEHGYHWRVGGEYLTKVGWIRCGISGVVSEQWWDRSENTQLNDTIDARLGLMDAYAAADQETRERWATDTRELVPQEVK